MMQRKALVIFACTMSGLALVFVGLPTIDRHLALRFMLLFVVAAVGLPFLIALAWPGPLWYDVPDRRVVAAKARAAAAAKKASSGAAKRPAGAVATAAGRAPQPVVEAEEEVADRIRWAARIGVAFSAWALLSSVVSSHPALSFFGLYINGNGEIMVLAFVSAWAIGVAVGAELRRPLEWVLIGSTLLNALVAVIEGALGKGLIAGRAPGLLDNPVYVAAILAAGLWLVVRRFDDDPRIWAPAVVVITAGIQASGSRWAAILIPVAVVGALLFMPWRTVAAVGALAVAGLVIGALLIGLGSTPSSTSRRADASVRPRLSSARCSPSSRS